MQGGLYSFWFTNHWLEDAELRWQVDQMSEKGFSGVFMHPRDGLHTPWNSNRWFDCVAIVRDQCQKNHMELWIYDEDPYPSGVAGGQVFLDHPDYIARHLLMEQFSTDGGDIVFDFTAGHLLRVVAIPEGTADQSQWIDLTADTGVVRTQWSQPWLRKDGYYSPYGAEGTSHWRASTQGLELRTTATLPHGQWTVYAFTQQLSSWGRWGYYADILNPAAMEYFIQLAYEPYRERFAQDFGGTIPGVFTDEPSLTGTHPWSPVFEAFFQERFGYSIIEHLPHLYVTLHEESYTIRYHYRRALGELYRQSFTRPIAQWCENNNLMLTGHISPEEDPIRQTYSVPYLLSQLKEMGLPGTDLINGHIGSATMPLLHLGPKFPSSAAQHTGKTRAMVEAYGANNWDTDFTTLIKMTDWLVVLGITDVVAHGQYYSVDGLRKKEAPPSYFYQSAAWTDFSAFSEYLNTLSHAMSQGKRHCKVLVYYPQATFSALIPDLEDKAFSLRHDLGEFAHTLLSNGWDFDIIDEETLADYTVEEGRLVGPHTSYDVFLLPSASVLEASVAEFVNHGLKSNLPLWFTHPVEHVVNGDVVLQNCPVLSPEEILHQLERCATRPFCVQTPLGNTADGYLQLRRVGEVLRAMFTSALEVPQEVSLTHPTTEESVEITLPANQSFVVDVLKDSFQFHLLSGQLGGAPLEYLQGEFSDKEPLPQWSITPLEDNVYPLAWWKRTVQDNTEGLDLSLAPDKAFEEPVCYTTSFQWEGDRIPLYLVSERSSWEGVGVLTVNGTTVPPSQRVRRFDTYNYQTDIASLLQPGENTLRLRLDKGRLCEPLRLYGAFRVEKETLRADSGGQTIAPPAPWHTLGYDYYGGTMAYKTHWKPSQHSRQVWLEATQVKDSATLVCNGQECATLCTAPYAWNITKALLPEEENEIILKVTNNSAGLLEQRIIPSGVLGTITIVTKE